MEPPAISSGLGLSIRRINAYEQNIEEGNIGPWEYNCYSKSVKGGNRQPFTNKISTSGDNKR